MENLERRVAKLEQMVPEIYPCVIIVGDEDEEATIEHYCEEHGITRQAFDAVPPNIVTVVRIRIIKANPR